MPDSCDPMDYSPPGSSVHGIFQARVLEWVAIFSSRDLPNPGIKPGSPALQADPSPLSHQGSLDMYTLLYLKWITNKDLLYSTWNSAQLLCGRLDVRGVWGRMDTHVYIYMAESLCCLPETVQTLLIGYMPIWNKKLKIKF